MYSNERMPGLAEGMGSIGNAMAAWGQAIQGRRQMDALEGMFANLMQEPPTDPATGQPAGPDPFGGFRQLVKGLKPKDLARIMGSEAFTPAGLKNLASIGQAGTGHQLIPGEAMAKQFPNHDLKGYIFQQDENGKMSALVSPQRPVSLNPGQYLVDPLDPSKVLAQAPERLQIANISQGGQLRMVDPNTGASYVVAERAPAPSGGGGGGGGDGVADKTPNIVLQIPSIGPGGETTTDFYEYQRGKGGTPGAMVGKITTGEKPMSNERAGRITGVTQGTELVKELRDIVMPGGKVDRGALVSKAVGLPGVVAPQGASIRPKLLQAIDPYVRATTGAALNQQELENAATMFDPRATDSDEMIKDKLDRLEKFLSGNVNLLTGIAVPGSPVSKAIQQKAAPQQQPAAKPQAAASKPAVPQVGAVQGGYRFKGGDPSKKENWEKTP